MITYYFMRNCIFSGLDYLTSSFTLPILVMMMLHWYNDDWDFIRAFLFRYDVQILFVYMWMLFVGYRHMCIEEISAIAREARRLRRIRKREAKRELKLSRKGKKGRHRRTYKTQGFASLARNFVKREVTSAVIENEEFIKKEIEALLLLLVSVQDSKTWRGVLAAILSFVKSHFDTSLSSVVIQCIQDIFSIDKMDWYKIQGDKIPESRDDDNEETDAEDDEAEGEEAEWLQTLRLVNSNWKLAVNNEGFAKISKLLSLLIGAGLVSASSMNADVAGLQLFSELSVPKHVSAFDLTDAALNTVTYFVEGGYESMRTGSMKPLLYGEHEMRKFDEDYLKCRKFADYARPGNLAMLSIDENDLDKLYADTIDLGKRLYRTVKSSLIKKQLQDRLTKLQDLQSTFQQYRQSGGIREKPYCIGIYGTSSVGKSTIGPLLMVSSLVYNGFRADDESMIVLNEHDKYMSNYKSSINGVFLDDVGNTKADFVETAPTVRILELVNNVKMYANMAEAELKGKVSIQPKVVVCTTNVKDFCAHTYSNEPVSIARRADIILTATVKPQFAENNMLSTRLVEEFYGKDDIPDVPDLWHFKVEKAYPIPSKTRGKPDDIGWRTLVWNGVEMNGVDIYTVMKFVNADSKRHFGEQKRIVKNNSHLAKRMAFCEGCKSHKSICMCGDMEHVVTYVDTPKQKTVVPLPKNWKPPNAAELAEARFEEELRKKPRPYVNHSGEYVRRKVSDFVNSFSSDYSWDDVFSRLEQFTNPVLLTIANWTPSRFFENRGVRILYAYWYGYFPRYVQYLGLVLAISFTMLVGAMLPRQLLSLVYIVFAFCCARAYLWLVEYNLLIRTTRDTTVGERLHRIEMSTKIKYILAGSALLATAYMMCRSYKSAKGVFGNQGMMHPTQKEIDDRDANDLTDIIKEEMNWANLHVTSVPVSHKSKTTTHSDLKKMVRNNLTFMSTTINDTFYGTNAFFVCSNVMLIPHHSWVADEMLCQFTRHDRDSIGGNFPSYVSRKHSVDIPGMDASLVWVPNGGSWRDLRDFFPQTMPVGKNNPAEFIWKDHRGIVKTSPTAIKHCQAKNGHMSYPGGYYTLNFDTIVGMCMSPLVSETKSPYFAAFHLGGITNTPKGCGGTILRHQIDTAMAQLAAIPSVLLSASAGTLETEKYGIQYMTSSEIHEKSPLRRLPILDGKCPNIEVFGTCLGRVTYYSDVVTSCISKHVETVCGVANKWGPPKFRKGDPWHASLQHSCQPSHGIEGSLLTRACDDYLRPFEKMLRDYHSLRNSTRPLTRMEVICGIDGKKFVDKMPPNTSVGYPLSGPKRAYLTYLDPEMFEGFNCPAELDDMFWKEFEKAEEIYTQGERYYPAFKACLKDEPTKLSKDKVRVFQAAPIVLQMMTRKYFLPIARILSLFPALSECAVGINCQGPDWAHLSEHMRKYGKDRILAGDYSKYDLRMPAQVMFAAFRILIEIARICGYSDRDITIMTGIATDICYPVMAYNGDLIQHIGSNPSGQNLTVYINSVVNSLLFRSAFYNLRGVESKIKFRDICALMTYGDDVKGSVKTGNDDFNHLYCAEFFAKHDMVFTMPDKESAPTPFMRDVDADFLKRKNVFCAHTGCIMGALDEESIFKSLHSNLKSKANTKEKLAADNIDGALREWFNHGEGIYEKRREQMREVAELAGISHMCTLLDQTYFDRVEHWKDRYIRGVVEDESIPDADDYIRQAGEIFLDGDGPTRMVQIFDDIGNTRTAERSMNEDTLKWIEYLNFVDDCMEIIESVIAANSPEENEEQLPALVAHNVLRDLSALTETEKLDDMRQLLNIILRWQEAMPIRFMNSQHVAVITAVSSMWLLHTMQRQWSINYMQAIYHPTVAVAAYCGEEFFVLSPYDHCNGTTGFFWWETPWIKLLSAPAIFYFHYAWQKRMVSFKIPTWCWYHYILIWQLINFGGAYWLFWDWFYQAAAGQYVILMVRLVYHLIKGSEEVFFKELFGLT